MSLKVAMVDRNCLRNDRSLAKFSATPNTAWNDVCIAMNVESNIKLIALKVCKTDSMDWKAGLALSSASWINLLIKNKQSDEMKIKKINIKSPHYSLDKQELFKRQNQESYNGPQKQQLDKMRISRFHVDYQNTEPKKIIESKSWTRYTRFSMHEF